MSAYQLLKQFQDEVERITGTRPSVDVCFFSDLTDEQCSSIRDNFVTEEGKLRAFEVELSHEGGTWTAYKAQNVREQINVVAHGPLRKKVQTCGV